MDTVADLATHFGDVGAPRPTGADPATSSPLVFLSFGPDTNIPHLTPY